MRKSSRLSVRADAAMPLIDERVLFDATVICGAFVRPDGVNYKLLELADDGLIDGFTTDVAAYEFVYNAYKGNLTGGDPIDPELLSEFLDGFPYLFDPETTPRVSIGRNVVDRVWMLRKPVGQVVYGLTGRQRADLLTQLHEQQVVGVDDFDPSDLHLLVAAVEQGADIVCTSNTTDLRQPAYGSIRVAAPSALYREIFDA
jgi:predicted nucleic acid-binding protein